MRIAREDQGAPQELPKTPRRSVSPPPYAKPPSIRQHSRITLNRTRGKAIKYIVNTHFHGDHTGGNGEFATKDKATVVAHQNIGLRLEHGTTHALSGQRT